MHVNSLYYLNFDKSLTLRPRKVNFSGCSSAASAAAPPLAPSTTRFVDLFFEFLCREASLLLLWNDCTAFAAFAATFSYYFRALEAEASAAFAAFAAFAALSFSLASLAICRTTFSSSQ
jgi:hypothetical protein